MENSLEEVIEIELKKNLVFKKIFEEFEIPKIKGLDEKLDLVYKSNEYMGYYKQEIYFDLIPKKEKSNLNGTFKLTLTSNVKEFDIKKAMQLVDTDEIHNVSVTFMMHNIGDGWDTARYNYTLWKNRK